MSNHADRMRQLGMTAAFVRAIAEDERAANERSTPEFRKYADQCFKRAMARLRTQMDNGAGLAMDSSLRDFLLEYNHRGWSHGLDSFPSSFNILEAFLKRDEKLAYFRLREEADHLVDIPRFFDYVTGSAAPSIALDLASTIEAGVVYNFNATDPFHQLSFRGTKNDDFIVSGASMVRHGHELSMVVLLGQIADLAERTRDLVDHSEIKVAPGKEALRPHEDFTRRAEPLLGSENHWRCLVMLRFDLESETRDAAYVSFDCGDVYQTITDDISTFDGVRGTMLSDDEVRNYMDRIREYEPLIEVARACLYLPLMFDSLSHDVDVERHETRYRSERNKVERRKDRKLVPPQLRISHRNVATLAATGRPAPDRFGFQSSTMRMDVSGYWKKLPPGSVGQDKRGREIHGRTWVHRELRWHERATGAAVATKVPTSHGASPGENAGSIYIMRSAAHAKDIFKVGLTRRDAEERAAELSRTTGSPDHFLVVQEWEVDDCVEAERIAHDRLRQYRLTDRREFFRIPYSDLVRIVGEVVEGVRST